MLIKLVKHADECYPNESCGLIVNDDYFPCRNIGPIDNFEIHPDDWIAAEELGDIQAIVHSHPDWLPTLSAMDRVSQVKSGLPWWVICDESVHKYECRPHLLGRTFEHGKLDCFSIIRDAYHLAGIEIKNYEREDDWWKDGKNYYMENIIDAGFYRVDSPQEGDVILISLGNDKPNHGTIYAGNQQILHSRPDRLSKRDVYGGFWQQYTDSIWRHKDWLHSSWAAVTADLEASMSLR
ncbi:tail assembly protein [Yersinia phage vB_YenS_P400]|nr:tail assembly protein [Yersinia phage vB_YenS_P400]